MIRSFKALFADHPHEVDETYLEHQATAFGVAGRLARLSSLAVVHGLFPGLYKTAVSDGIRRMARDLGSRAEDARDTRMREDGVWDPGL